MSDPKKKKQTDSTTDFFLQFVKEEKFEKEKTEAKKEKENRLIQKQWKRSLQAITTLISCWINF